MAVLPKGISAFLLSTLIRTALAEDTSTPSYLPSSGERVKLKPMFVEDRREQTYASHRSSTATRTDLALLDIPQAVGVVTRELIDDQAMQGMSDVTRYVPGAGIAQGEGNRDTPVLRGSGTTADFLVDGMRDDVQYFRDLYAVDRVEILKGPNAMIFGRGGAGGIINRVMKQPDGVSRRELTFQGGAWEQVRATLDLGASGRAGLSYRLAALREQSGSYRDGVRLRRHGLTPMLGWRLAARSRVRLTLEHFRDERTADRGVPSLRGRPLPTAVSTFFGDPEQSRSLATVDSVQAEFEHRFGPAGSLRSSTRYGRYDKTYQNVFPGAVDLPGTAVAISAYRNATQRDNLLHQTEVIVPLATGRTRHELLAGVEWARQQTSNLRLTGYFNPAGTTVTTVSVPVASPRLRLPVTFRPGATDADNRGLAEALAIYVQDQIALRPWLQAVVGLRVESFSMAFRDDRAGASPTSRDQLVSPRASLILKPSDHVAVYVSQTEAYLPRAGEQLSSLTLANRALAPEGALGRELGVKWDVRPDLALTACLYRLDRRNVVIPDPVDTTRSILADGQRAEGAEFGLTGHLSRRWGVVGGYAYQDGRTRSAESAAVPAGTRLAQLPRHTLSLWNRYDPSERWGFGLGLIHRGEIFAAADNAVRLPGFVRVDAAVFHRLNRRIRLQANVENVLDRTYHASAHNNNNLTPGAPRTLRLGLSARL